MSGHVDAGDVLGAHVFIASEDPFGQVDAGENVSEDRKNTVHVRCQQRNGRKCITSIQGLHVDLDFKKLVKAFKKEFSCNGSVTESSEHGTVPQLSGDQRQKVSEFLIRNGIVKKENIVLHGF
eukprot:Hpha_TRINITY_DN15149_c2_g1::TRINITY_DN15149_c2_g1_i2::g.129947::m.129947/K03113/EIF1, SUI1; translation initiation factor 1